MFNDRLDAGKQLGELLSEYRKKKQVLVLAIPRGGVEVGHSISERILCPLDIVTSKKISYPGHSEVAIGALCNDVVRLDKTLIEAHDIDSHAKEEIKKIKAATLKRRARLTGCGNVPLIKNKTIIVTDDGMATGHTFMAAVDFVKSHNPKKIVAAIPVCPQETVGTVEKAVDEAIIIETPERFASVGAFYQNFKQLTDKDTAELLRKNKNALMRC